MKKIIIVFLAFVLVVPLFSQEVNESYDGFKPGYKGILEFKGGLVHIPLGGEGLRQMTNIINGCQISRYLYTGIGIGLYTNANIRYSKVYSDHRETIEGKFLPVFASISWNILDKRISPNLSLATGYLFNLVDYDNMEASLVRDTWYYDKYNDGCFILNPNGEIIIKITERFGLIFGVGYLLKLGQERLISEGDWYGGTSEYYSNEPIGEMTLNIGISLNMN